MFPPSKQKKSRANASPAQPSPRQVKDYLREQNKRKEEWLERHSSENLGLDFSFLDGKGERFLPSCSTSRRISEEIEATVKECIKDCSEPPALDQSIRDCAPDILRDLAETQLFRLRAMARAGDVNAFERLVSITRNLTVEINEYAMRFSNANFIPHLASWPVLAGPFKQFRHDDKKIIRQLRVGASSLERATPVLSDGDTLTAPHLALALMRRLEYWRTRDRSSIYWNEPHQFLPPTKAEDAAFGLGRFGPETWKQWADLAWQLILEINGEHPERDERLRRIGRFKEKKLSSKYPGNEDKIKKSTDANNRDGIHQQLASAFKRLAEGKRGPFSTAVSE